jgi:hypothetical protein
MNSEPVLNMADAARACGLSVSTLTRHRDELIAHGAQRTDRSWRIPISALVSTGLLPRTTPPDRSDHQSPTPVMTGHDDESITALRAALAKAEQRAAIAEAIAVERERTILAQAHALRLLEAAPTPQQPTPNTQPTPQAPTTKRSWWHRQRE